MTHNDILRQLRYALDYYDSTMVDIFALGGHTLVVEEATNLLRKEDDPDFVESVKGVLEDAGKAVYVAQNGREAVKRVSSNGIDVLILDLRMPVLNGLETYIELKKAGHAVPTIIVTAFADEEKGALDYR